MSTGETRMLGTLLGLIEEGGARRIADLAKKLDVTPLLIETMLEDLGRRGYLKRIDGSCNTQCESCPFAGLCSSGSSSGVWVLTEKAH